MGDSLRKNEGDSLWTELLKSVIDKDNCSQVQSFRGFRVKDKKGIEDSNSSLQMLIFYKYSKGRYDMSESKSKQKNKRRRWMFSLEAIEAENVILMGDFNNWNPEKHPMKKDENGMWIKALILHPGNYEYKFMVDGQWIEDPQNDRLCPNCFGTYNNVLNLPEA